MPKIITCLDALSPLPDGRHDVWSGWWLADFQVRRLVAVDEEGNASAVWLGDARPDVGAAFPESALAGRSGFMLLREAGQATGKGCWWFETPAGKWGTCEADWRVTHPSTIEGKWMRPGEVPANVIGVSDATGVEGRFKIALARGAGITLRLDLINKCNLRCIMCHYSMDEVFKRPAQSVTLEQFKDLFKGVASIVGEVILSCADEPLASKYFPEILTCLRRARPDVIIRFCTNATLMSAALRRIIVEQRVDHVLFSIDGVHRATFEGIRTGAKFDRVLGHISSLRELRDRSGAHGPILTANFVMMTRNIHEAPVFIELARRLGLTYLDFRHVVECFSEFDLFHEQLQSQPARFNYYRGLILEAAAREKMSIYLPPAFAGATEWRPGPDEPRATLEDVDAALATTVSDPAVAEVAAIAPNGPSGESMQAIFGHTYCTRPFSEIAIRNQNEVMPCSWHRTHLGTLSEMPQLSDHFFGPRFQELRQAMMNPEGHANCRGCPLKSQDLPSERHDS